MTLRSQLSRSQVEQGWACDLLPTPDVLHAIAREVVAGTDLRLEPRNLRPGLGMKKFIVLLGTELVGAKSAGGYPGNDLEPIARGDRRPARVAHASGSLAVDHDVLQVVWVQGLVGHGLVREAQHTEASAAFAVHPPPRQPVGFADTERLRGDADPSGAAIRWRGVVVVHADDTNVVSPISNAAVCRVRMRSPRVRRLRQA